MALLAKARALALEHGLREMGAAADLQCARSRCGTAIRRRRWPWPTGPQLPAIRRARRSGLPTAPTCAAGLRSARSTSMPPSATAGRAVAYLQAGRVWPGYQVTYRLNEAYALLGTGATTSHRLPGRAARADRTRRT
jgi:hypothetical protein